MDDRGKRSSQLKQVPQFLKPRSIARSSQQHVFSYCFYRSRKAIIEFAFTVGWAVNDFFSKFNWRPYTKVVDT